MSIKNLVFSICAVLIAPDGNCQYANSEGAYSSKTVNLQVMVFESDKGTVAASTTVVQGACSGTIAGLGKIKDRKLVFSPYAKEEGGESCSVTVEFDRSFNSGKISTNESCHVYHGASCGWEGQVLVKSKSK